MENETMRRPESGMPADDDDEVANSAAVVRKLPAWTLLLLLAVSPYARWRGWSLMDTINRLSRTLNLRTR